MQAELNALDPTTGKYHPVTINPETGAILTEGGGGGSTGGLTDAQLRATPVPTSNASLLASQTITFVTSQSVAISATSAQSDIVNAGTSRVILASTTDCWVNIGSNPTSIAHTTGSGFLLPAGGQSYPISVTGGTTKISVIQESASGYLSINEIA